MHDVHTSTYCRVGCGARYLCIRNMHTAPVTCIVERPWSKEHVGVLGVFAVSSIMLDPVQGYVTNSFLPEAFCPLRGGLVGPLWDNMPLPTSHVTRCGSEHGMSQHAAPSMARPNMRLSACHVPTCNSHYATSQHATLSLPRANMQLPLCNVPTCDSQPPTSHYATLSMRGLWVLLSQDSSPTLTCHLLACHVGVLVLLSSG
jgi:hypothetical protein